MIARTKVTSILLSWKRPRNLSLISQELRRSRLIDEVFVWNNNAEVTPDIDSATTITSSQNLFCLPRYCLIPLAKNETIWFQDDDVLLTAEQIHIIFNAYLRDQSRIYGIRGRNLDSRGRYLKESVVGECDIVLGQAMLFHRSLADSMFSLLSALPPVTVEDDIVLSLSCKKRHMAVPVGAIEDLGSSDSAALWRLSDHFAKRQRMVDLILQSQRVSNFARPHQPPG